MFSARGPRRKRRDSHQCVSQSRNADRPIVLVPLHYTHTHRGTRLSSSSWIDLWGWWRHVLCWLLGPTSLPAWIFILLYTPSREGLTTHTLYEPHFGIASFLHLKGFEMIYATHSNQFRLGSRRIPVDSKRFQNETPGQDLPQSSWSEGNVDL